MALLLESRPLFSVGQDTCHGLTWATCPTTSTTRCTWAVCSTRMNHKRYCQCSGSCPLTAEKWFYEVIYYVLNFLSIQQIPTQQKLPKIFDIISDNSRFSNADLALLEPNCLSIYFWTRKP